jgi:hypothetical protein
MNPVDLIIAARAAQEGRAQLRRERRHVHLEKRPIAIAAMQMSIESHAIWGALVGDTPGAPELIVAPEPRTPSIAFGAMTRLAQIVCNAVDSAAGAPRIQILRRGRPPRQRCSTAPQLLVANEAVVGLLDRLGRRMRPAGYGGHVKVPAEVNLAGAHLGFYAEMAARPGSALTIVATRELAQHFATGQSSFENAHLGAQLAWHDPEYVERLVPGIARGIDLARIHGADAASLIETTPMSVLTDPDEDNGPLLEAVSRFNEDRSGSTDPAVIARLGGEVGRLLRSALEPTWRGLWLAYDILDALPTADSCEERWQQDLDAFTSHADYIAKGGRRASVDSAKRAALVLADWESAQARYERDQVLEDGYGLLGAIAAGQAILGEVLTVDTNNREPGPSGKTQVKRPLVSLSIPGECPFPVGAELWWTDRLTLGVEVVSVDANGKGGTTVVLKVMAGMNGELPSRGARACFSSYNQRWIPPAPLPKQAPWTHTAPTGSAVGRGDIDDGPGLDAVLGLDGGRRDQ